MECLVRIKIDHANSSKLQEVLDRENGRAYAHVASASDVIALAARAEAFLADRGIPLRQRSGSEAFWCDKGPAAKSYGYKRTQTALKIVRSTGRHWFLTKPARVGVYPQQREQYRITISATQRDHIIKTALACFEVRNNVHLETVSPATPTDPDPIK